MGSSLRRIGAFVKRGRELRTLLGRVHETIVLAPRHPVHTLSRPGGEASEKHGIGRIRAARMPARSRPVKRRSCTYLQVRENAWPTESSPSHDRLLGGWTTRVACLGRLMHPGVKAIDRAADNGSDEYPLRSVLVLWNPRCLERRQQKCRAHAGLAGWRA